MKSKLLLGTLAVLSAVLTVHGAKQLLVPHPVSKRVIKIGKKPQLTLIKNGKVTLEVVSPVNSKAQIAARELVTRLKEISGQKIKVVKKASGKVPAFYLGVCPESKAAGLDPAKVDRDGFYIKTVGNKIFITGVDHQEGWVNQTGTLYGVYDFLERFAGVRYYFPGEIGTIVPKKKNWSLPSIDIAERPDTQYRWIWTSPSTRGGSNFPYPYPGMKENNPRIWRNSALHRIRSCHGLNALELSKRFAKTNPEFFALMADGRRWDGISNSMGYHKLGHLCYSSEGLKEVVYQDAVACLTGKPASSRGISHWDSRWTKLYINPTPNDGVMWCLCPKCKKIMEKGKQAMSDHIWNFVIDIANRLKKNKIAGTVIMDSYGAYKEMPTRKIPDNISVSVAIGGPWNMNNKKLRDEQNNRLTAWRKRTGQKLATWTYPTKASIAVPAIPNFTPRAVAAFYKSQKNNIYGGFVESGTDVWLFGFMNHYVCGKVLWDFNTDVEKIMDEHCRLMYGKGAPYIAKFYKEIERIWMSDLLKERYQTSFGDYWLLPTRKDLWTKVYSPQKMKELTDLWIKAEKAAAKDKMALKRIRFMRANFWAPVVQAADAFTRESASRSAWTICAEPAKKITLDGKLNEKEWKNAAHVNLVGGKWEPIQVQTTVKALFDKDYLYFGFEAFEPYTAKMNATRPPKPDSGEIWRDNGIEVFLSAEGTSKFIYQFMVNSLGAKCDLRNTLTTVSSKYNTNFEAKCSVNPGKSYCVEIRIPRKAMPELAGRTKLVANFTRNRVIKGMTVKPDLHAWFPKKRNIPEDFGILLLDKKGLEKNLITAPDFDFPLISGKYMCVNGWAGNRQITVDNKVFLTRGASACLDNKSTSIIQTIPVKPNTKYRLSFYVKAEKASPGLRSLVRFGYNVQGFYVFGTYKDYIRGTTNWHRVEKVFTTPKKFGTGYPPRLDIFTSKGEKGKCWIDHVELVEVK